MTRTTFSSFTPINSFTAKPDLRSLFQKITLRSSAYAISAYFIVLMGERLFILAGSLLNGFTVVLKHNTVKVIAPGSAWDQESVMLIYLVPLLIQIIFFVWLNIRFIQAETSISYKKIFMLWLMFFVLYRITGIIPANIITGTGINYVLTWLYTGIILKISIGIIAAGLFILTGFKILRGILAISGIHNSNIRDIGVFPLIISTVFLPLIIVLVFAILFYIPDFPRAELIGLLFIFVLLIYFIIKMSKLDLGLFLFKEGLMENGNQKWLFITSVISVVVLRIVLGLEIKL